VPSQMALISFYSVPSSAGFTVGLAYWLRMLGVCSTGHCYQSFTHGTSARHQTEDMCPLVPCDYSFSPSRSLVQPSVPFLFRLATGRSRCPGSREAGAKSVPKSVPRKPEAGAEVGAREAGADFRFRVTDRPTSRFPLFATRNCIGFLTHLA
jgi:hypothetical protein